MKKRIEELCIKIHYSSDEGGYYYDIYDVENPEDDTVSVDGGLCTTTLENALDMATDQAKTLLAAHNAHECMWQEVEDSEGNEIVQCEVCNDIKE